MRSLCLRVYAWILNRILHCSKDYCVVYRLQQIPFWLLGGNRNPLLGQSKLYSAVLERAIKIHMQGIERRVKWHFVIIFDTLINVIRLKWLLFKTLGIIIIPQRGSKFQVYQSFVGVFILLAYIFNVDRTLKMLDPCINQHYLVIYMLLSICISLFLFVS